MKIIFLVVIFFVIVGVGFIIKFKYLKKEKFFKDALLFCDILTPNISFIKMPIKSILNKNKDKFSKDFCDVLNNYENFLDNNEDLAINLSYLKQDDSENIMYLLKNIGRCDVDSELQLINNCKLLLNKDYEKAALENKKFGAVSLKICICMAVAAVILLI